MARNFVDSHAKRENLRAEAVRRRRRARARAELRRPRCGSTSGCSRRRSSPVELTFADVAREPRQPRLVRSARGSRARRSRASFAAAGPRLAPARLSGDARRRPSAALGRPGRLERVLRARARQPDPARHPLGPADRRLRAFPPTSSWASWSRAPRRACWSAISSTRGLAVRLMRRTGRDDVTAMPFGIDTPVALRHRLRGARARPCC